MMGLGGVHDLPLFIGAALRPHTTPGAERALVGACSGKPRQQAPLGGSA